MVEATTDESPCWVRLQSRLQRNTRDLKSPSVFQRTVHLSAPALPSLHPPVLISVATRRKGLEMGRWEAVEWFVKTINRQQNKKTSISTPTHCFKTKLFFQKRKITKVFGQRNQPNRILFIPNHLLYEQIVHWAIHENAILLATAEQAGVHDRARLVGHYGGVESAGSTTFDLLDST